MNLGEVDIIQEATAPRPGAPAENADFQALYARDARAWVAFVGRWSTLVQAWARRVLSPQASDDAQDVAQLVFVRLCADDFRLLRSYDPGRAGLATWLRVVTTSTAIDHLRRRKVHAPIDLVDEALLGIDPPTFELLNIPAGLLTGRQAQVLALLYGQDLDVAEVARRLNIDPQSVRSARHMALVRLRAHFNRGDG